MTDVVDAIWTNSVALKFKAARYSETSEPTNYFRKLQ